jgi:hypothetical protein
MTIAAQTINIDEMILAMMNVDQFINRPDDITKIEKGTAIDFLGELIKLLEARKEPQFMRIEDVQRLFFVGDLHGDFTVMKAVVRRFLE